MTSQITVYEAGETVYTRTTSGEISTYKVQTDGSLKKSEPNRDRLNLATGER